MSGEYTPTVGEVRGVYVASGFRENLPHSHQSLAEWRAEFDRWLVRVRAEAQVKALREAKQEVRASSFWADGSDNYADRVRGWLSNRADRIARSAGIEQEDEG